MSARQQRREPVLDGHVIRNVYDAAIGELPWADVLEALAEFVGGSACYLGIIESSTRRLIHLERSDADQRVFGGDGEAAFLNRLFDRLRSEASGKLKHWLEPTVIPPERPPKSQRSHHGSVSLVGSKLRQHDRHAWFFAISRPSALGPFRPRELGVIASVVAHLIVALDVADRWQTFRAAATIGNRLIESTTRPIFLVAPNRLIIATNSPARELLAKGDLVHAESGFLKCRGKSNAETLDALLGRFAVVTGPDESRRKREAALLEGADDFPILCSVLDVRTDRSTMAVGAHPVALLSFTSLRIAEQQMDTAFLTTLYDFTPAEMRLVSALLKGDDLSRIANTRLVSVATLRSQLKSVFAKTNTHRQIELLQLLLVLLLL